MKKKFFAVLMLAFVLALNTTPTACAADRTAAQAIADCVAAFNADANHGTGELKAEVNGDTVTITGTVTDAEKPLVLKLEGGLNASTGNATVNWQADLTGSVYNYLVYVSGYDNPKQVITFNATKGHITNQNSVGCALTPYMAEINVSGAVISGYYGIDASIYQDSAYSINITNSSLVAGTELGVVGYIDTLKNGGVVYGGKWPAASSPNASTELNPFGIALPSFVIYGKLPGEATLTAGSTNGLRCYPANATGNAEWAVEDGKSGIYVSGSGFVELPGLTVTEPTGVLGLNKSKVTLAVGETFQAEPYKVNPADAEVKWMFGKLTSSGGYTYYEVIETDIATVDANGLVTAQKEGTVTLLGRAAKPDGTWYNQQGICQITVVKAADKPTVAVTGVQLNQTALNLEINGTATLTATVAPENATNKSVRWSSNNTAVATVDANGNLKAVAPGKATITVTTEDGRKTATCEVTVSEKRIPVTSITLDKTSLSLEVKNTAQLKATVLPADTTSKIAWTSSNEKVATVNETGKVTALTKGAATITATADGVKAECRVTVTADTVYTITFDTDGGTLAAGITNPDYVVKGAEYKMPTANKSRYKLTAWAIGSKDSANQVKANDVYTFTEDTTVYAIWQYNGGGGGGSHRPSGSGTTTPTTPTKPTNPEKPGNSGNTGSSTVTAANIKNVFADVQNNAWYSEAIAYVYNKGMMNGTDAGKFEPNATTTRAMLVTMLHRLENEPAAAAAKFSDVASGQWFSKAVAWAAANGVVNGYENGTFAPNAAITREQLAAILYRFAQFKGYDVSVKGNLSSFSDNAQVSDWAKEAMQWAVGAGIINGDNNALKPTGNATRAEVAIMLMRYIENVK